MPLDSLIIQNLKRQSTLDEALEADIEKAFKTLSLDEILSNPSAVLGIFAEDLGQLIIDRHATKYILEGVKFSDAVDDKDGKLNFNENPDDNPSNEEIDGESKHRSQAT